MSKRELFYLPGRELRVQQDATGSRSIVGSILYNSPSSGLPWTETIAPGAFAGALETGAEVLLLRNHDVSQLYGNTLSGTLILSDSPQGLNFRCQLPNTSQAADLIESVTRLDLQGTSFGFAVKKDRWEDDGNGNLSRSLDSVTLYEISLCNWAAFPEAGFSLRSVPKALRPLMKRSHPDGCDCDCSECAGGDCEECTDEACSDPACAEAGCPNQDAEDRSSRLSWTERVMLHIEVAKRK